MKTVLLIYVLGLIPAYLSLRHSFIRLSGVEGRTAVDALLMVLSTLCSWIAVVVTMTMMSVMSIDEIEQTPLEGYNQLRVRRA